MKIYSLIQDSTLRSVLGEHIAQFANMFTDPPAYWWQEWPDWLLQDEQGVIIPIARPEYVVKGVETCLHNFINLVPDGMIRFNLDGVTQVRRFTIHELKFVIKQIQLRERTTFTRRSPNFQMMNS